MKPCSSPTDSSRPATPNATSLELSTATPPFQAAQAGHVVRSDALVGGMTEVGNGTQGRVGEGHGAHLLLVTPTPWTTRQSATDTAAPRLPY